MTAREITESSELLHFRRIPEQFADHSQRAPSVFIPRLATLSLLDIRSDDCYQVHKMEGPTSLFLSSNLCAK